MIDKCLSFLNEIGFSDIQLNIYKYLLIHKSGTIIDIKKELNYSYTQVYHNLIYLKQYHLIESSTNSKTKVYSIINPRIALTDLINKKFNVYREKVKDLDEELEILNSKDGRCLRDVTFYHYSDIGLAINNFFKLFDNTKKEIVLTSLPLSFLKKIEPGLYNAFMHGIDIKLYFSLLDYEGSSNILEELTEILKRIRIEITQTVQKTCMVIKYNDELVNMGNILIDETYLNSLIFTKNEVLHCDGFVGPYAKQAKEYLNVLEQIKTIKLEYPESIKNVLNIIEESNMIKTRDLSSKSKLGGARLREILEFLVSECVIEEKLIKDNKPGRPKRVYSLIE